MTATATLTHIPAAQVHRDPEQPRREFDRAGLEELAESIAQHGILEPLIVRPGNAPGTFIIVAGERRSRAAQIAGLADLPCIVRTDAAVTDADSRLVLQATENVQRADMRPSEDANAYQRLLSSGRTVAEVARLMGKSETTIAQRVDLLKLCPEILDLLDKGHITIRLAWQLSRISHKGQMEIIGQFNAGRFPNDDAAIRTVDAIEKQEQQASLFEDAVLSAFDDARRRTNKTIIDRTNERIATMARGLAELDGMSPIDMAAALQHESPAMVARLDALLKQLGRLRATAADAAAQYQSWTA